jgi:hypothetical protein
VSFRSISVSPLESPCKTRANLQVDWHLSSGLAVVFIEAPERLQQTSQAPQVIYDQCEYWGKPTSGNVVGKNSTTDFKGQPLGPFPLVMVGFRICLDKFDKANN